jgi:mannose-6-phosphate isomerase-like protein (cupin superfamily)
VGTGFLKLSDFKELLRKNPRLRNIELSNYGELLLNPDLLNILQYAYEHGVALRADSGVNFNTANDELLDGLVKYRFRSMTCSIDGASEETYRRYRVNGSFSTVIENLRRLNAAKARHQSDFPELTWQFVAFGHNEHEISQARELAAALDMKFRMKLSWDPDFSPVADEELLRRELGAASREEYRQRLGSPYASEICYELWNAPQVNWDGRVLGCCRNFWGDFGANAFTDGLGPSVNGPGMRCARQMLLGKKSATDGIPCASCDLYADMRARGKWLKRSQIRADYRLANGSGWAARARKSVPYRGARFIYRSFKPGPDTLPMLTSRVYPLGIPLPPDQERGWKPYAIFSGSGSGLQTWSCHVSVLTKDTCPHPPHVHREEEILMLLSGEADLILPDIQAVGGNQCTHLEPGQFVYYPSRFAHTLQATSDDPANYLMFRWRGNARRLGSILPHGLFGTLSGGMEDVPAKGLSSRLMIEGPTKYLQKLHCHSSTLTAGQGYEPHEDRYDVALVVLEGEIETLDERVGPGSVVLYAAGEPHGMHNPGEVVARYAVFEFHSDPRRLTTRLRRIQQRMRG